MTADAPRTVFLQARSLVARNRFFAAALALGGALRLLAVLGYPGALWIPDSFVYLGTALRPQPDPARTTGYSLFLRTLIPFHSLTLVTSVQHLMGLGLAIMVYALARRSGVPPRWATAATLPILLDGFEIENEHMVMAEALFTFLAMLAMLMILWRDRVRWPVALLAGVLIGFAVDVRTEGLPVLVIFVAFLLYKSESSRGRRTWRNGRGWLAAGAMVVACAVPVLAYVGWFHAWNGDYELTRSDGFYLWGRVSSFAECSVIRPPADEVKLCPSGSPSDRPPPGDYIWSAPQLLDLTGGPLSTTNEALLRDFAFRAIWAQPLGYFHSVLGGLALSVEWPRRAYPDPETMYYYYFPLTPEAVPANRSWVPGGTAYSDATSYGHAIPSRVVEPFAIMISRYERMVYTPGPLFGLILLTGIGGVIQLGRHRPRVRWCRRTGSMLPWVTAVVLLVVPVATADFSYRYLLPVLPFACLAAGLAFAPERGPSLID